MTFSVNGLCGWVGESGVSLSPGTLAKMEVPLNPSAESPRKSTDTFAACVPKGWVESGDDSISIALTGNPYFEDAELASVSSRRNPAAAVLQAYRATGTDFLDKMRGAFAVVLHDPAKHIAVLATDRLARQTLYYARVGDALVFASNANAVLAHPGVESSLNPQGIFNYIYFHMVPSPGSIYQSIHKVSAAHCVVKQASTIRICNYWQPRFQEVAVESHNELCEELRSVLQRAVERSGSGRRVGAFLSGGLDSSSVVGMLAKHSSDAPVFSIGFDADGYDEMAYARVTAKHFNMTQHEYYVTRDDVVDMVPMIAAHYDEPFGNSSVLPTYMCAKLAAEKGVDCMLAGDGGDELFSGNERYAKQTVFERYRNVPGFLRKGLIEPVASAMPNRTWLVKKAKSYISQASLPLPDRLQTYNFLHRHSANELFENDFIESIDAEVPLQLMRDVYHTPKGATQLNRMLYMDWQFTLADNDLRKVNHMCALGGVDVVYPMLDDELVDFSCRIPSKMKMPGGALRDFYKKGVTGFLADETINKSKHGFGLPFGVWMKAHKPLQEMCYDNLEKLKTRGYIRPDFIDNAVEMHKGVHASFYGELVWILMMLELWLASRRGG